MDFAIGGFHEGEHRERIPKLPSVWDEIFDIFDSEVRHRGGFLKMFLLMDSEGNISYMALFAVYVLPLLTMYGFYRLMQLPFQTDEDTVEKTRILEMQNKALKDKMDAWV